MDRRGRGVEANSRWLNRFTPDLFQKPFLRHANRECEVNLGIGTKSKLSLKDYQEIRFCSSVTFDYDYERIFN